MKETELVKYEFDGKCWKNIATGEPLIEGPCCKKCGTPLPIESSPFDASGFVHRQCSHCKEMDRRLP